MQRFWQRPDAVAEIRGGPGARSIRGEAKFYRQYGAVRVVVDVRGLPGESETGIFALHIHEGPACTGEGFSDTGGHYNPNHTVHPSHAGDLPPLFSCAGRAHLEVLTDRFRIADVIGCTVVIHSDPDDFHSQPSGNAGYKIACGVIRKA